MENRNAKLKELILGLAGAEPKQERIDIYMLVSNVNDMKYAMRKTQRDSNCVCREFHEYVINDDVTAKFCIVYHWDHTNDNEGYICTWSFGKTFPMTGNDLIVRLVENREQSFDDVAKIALKEIGNAFTTKRYEFKLRRNTDIYPGILSSHVYANDIYDALIKLEERYSPEFNIKTDLLSIMREDCYLYGHKASSI
jgi:hypothetical protein